MIIHHEEEIADSEHQSNEEDLWKRQYSSSKIVQRELPKNSKAQPHRVFSKKNNKRKKEMLIKYSRK